MKKEHPLRLSRRESQIMDALYAFGEASVDGVRKLIGEPVSYDSVRVTLGVLERKGHVVHRADGVRFIYRPVVAPEEAKRSVLGHVLKTFFGGSAPRTVATLLDLSEVPLTPKELAEISRLVDEAATKKGKKRRKKKKKKESRTP